MTAHYLNLSLWQVGGATALILTNMAISVALRLGLARTLLIASVRMIVQLLLIGVILQYLFALEHPLAVTGVGLVMVLLASFAAVNRTQRRFRDIYWHSFIAVFSASFVVTGLALLGILQVKPWFNPQYAIPLLGMVLGNVLTGISLGLDHFMEGVARERGLIETQLALGATRWEAAHGLTSASLRTGLIPTVNAMMVMGVVSLPGMMTGQILAGAAPAAAVRYQIVIMFMIAAATALGTLMVVMLAYRTLFSPNLQLRSDRLYKREKGGKSV